MQLLKKLVILLLAVAALIGSFIYYKDTLVLVLTSNNYEQVAKQFWINELNNLNENNTSALPLNEKVNTFSFTLSDAQLQDGKYYFRTTLYINKTEELPIFTVVEPIQGQWKVNLNETFLSIFNASLDRYTGKFSDAILVSQKYVTLKGLHGFEASQVSAEHIESINNYIDEQFILARDEFKLRYLAVTDHESSKK